MAATISRLRTRPQRASDADADQLRALLQRRPDLLTERLSGLAIARLDQQLPSTNGWAFVMMSPQDHDLVVSWLDEHSARPRLALRLWSKLFLNLRRDTGEIMFTRDELASLLAQRPEHISRVMTELETIGAISKLREKVPGMRGPGVVRWFMSPRLATHITGQARDKAQKDAPQLRLV
jgi:hypothetical protein